MISKTQKKQAPDDMDDPDDPGTWEDFCKRVNDITGHLDGAMELDPGFWRNFV